MLARFVHGAKKEERPEDRSSRSTFSTCLYKIEIVSAGEEYQRLIFH
jgi:hypothetical protein